MVARLIRMLPKYVLETDSERSRRTLVSRSWQQNLQMLLQGYPPRQKDESQVVGNSDAPATSECKEIWKMRNAGSHEEVPDLLYHIKDGAL